MSNRPVTHDSLRSPEQAVTTRLLPEDLGGSLSQPHIWERAARAGRTCPAQNVSSVLAPGLRQAPVPADLAPQHPLGLRPPTCPPLALADPPALGAGSCCSARGEEGVVGQSRLTQARGAQLSTRHGGGGGVGGSGPSRPAHPSDPISAGPRHASGIHCALTTAQDRELGEQPDEGQDQLSARVRPQQREAFWKVLWRRKRLCPRPLLPWASSDPAGPAS